jgi:hypothetical protein
MKLKLSRPLAAAALMALAAVGTAAQARDVFWSLGVEAAPGVNLGVGNTRPVVVAPAPVYVAPQPVYVAPAPVVVPRRVYVEPAPVIYEETVIVRPGHGHGRHKEHHHHH